MEVREEPSGPIMHSAKTGRTYSIECRIRRTRGSAVHDRSPRWTLVTPPHTQVREEHRCGDQASALSKYGVVSAGNYACAWTSDGPIARAGLRSVACTAWEGGRSEVGNGSVAIAEDFGHAIAGNSRTAIAGTGPRKPATMVLRWQRKTARFAELARRAS